MQQEKRWLLAQMPESDVATSSNSLRAHLALKKKIRSDNHFIDFKCSEASWRLDHSDYNCALPSLTQHFRHRKFTGWRPAGT